jgi:hypothetical protein
MLSAGERRTIGALAAALYDPRGRGRLDAVLEDVLAEVEAWLAAPDLFVRSALRALLVVIDLSPVRFGFGARAMTGLPLHQRVRYLAALDARAASSLNVWKTLLGTAYFGHPVGAAEMQCDAPPADAPLHSVARLRRRAPRDTQAAPLLAMRAP